jgi:type IV pilus assembly protein PilX
MVKSNQQNGAVLVISLIILLLITLIGTAAIQTSTLEEKMAGNLYDKNIAFQAAEAALRQGEALANTINPATIKAANNGKNSTGIYQEGAILPNPFPWSNDLAVGNYKEGAFSQFKFPPRYIIEILQSTKSNGCSLEANVEKDSSCLTYWTRITAQGTGGSDNSVVKLQSIFFTLEK